MTTTTIPPSLATQAAETGGRIVLTVAGKSLYGIEGANPERRVVRILRALRKADVNTDKHQVRILKATPKGAVNVRGLTGTEIAEKF